MNAAASVEALGISERVPVHQQQIEAFCRRWKIREFALFGSVLRDDFRPDSDIDVLVEFAPDAQHTLLDRVVMAEELKALFGRDVDLVRKDRISNPFRREHILHHNRVVYAA
jgi:predicted nucleotidyltransferase